MEFGIFINGYLPGQAAHDPVCEHEMLKREIQYVVEADKYNWKYAWLGEHHSLTEYSHMSAPEVVMGYLAHATERIHVGTGIMNLSPRVNDPVRSAEGPFGQTIAHGYLTLSLLPVLLHSVLQVRGVGMGVNYGTNKVRFTSPVLVGSQIRAGATLASLEEIAGGAQVALDVTVEMKDAPKPSCVAQVVYRYYR